jgi:hypothetical protein
MSFSCVRSLMLLMLPLALCASESAFAAQQPKPGKTEAPVVVDWVPQPRIQVLLAMPDALIVKESYRIAVRTAFGMTVEALVVSEPAAENQRVKGLLIDLGKGTKPGDQSGTSLLDIEEAGALSQSLATMIEMSTKRNLDDRRTTDMSFATLGGFVVDLRIDGRGQTAYVQAGRTESIRTPIEVSDLGTVKTLVDEALVLLAAK